MVAIAKLRPTLSSLVKSAAAARGDTLLQDSWLFSRWVFSAPSALGTYEAGCQHWSTHPEHHYVTDFGVAFGVVS